MKKFTSILLLFLLLSITHSLFASRIEATDEFDFKLALDYCFFNRIDSIVLITSGGVYTTTDTLPLIITKPITIAAKPGLAKKPIFIHCDPDSDVLDMFRVCNDLTIDGVVFDGKHPRSHGMKYALRFGPADNNRVFAKIGANIIVKNCDFKDLYEKKDLELAGHALYFLRPTDATKDPIVKAGTVILENCTFENIGDEAIRISENEKYAVQKVVDTLIVRNCTFKNVDAECVRFYADLDVNTPDAYLLLDHLTIDFCGTAAIYLKNNAGAIVRNILLTNSRPSGRSDRNRYLIEAQGVGSVVSHVDTINIRTTDGTYPEVVRCTKGGTVDKSTVWGFDPQYTDPAKFDYTLKLSSPAYFAASDEKALGDLRWALLSPTRFPFYLTIIGSGTVTTDPPIQGRSYQPGVNVILTAIPDSGWEFVEWNGDLTGNTNPATVNVESAKRITATFRQSTGIETANGIPVEYNLSQNYPNPFNPTTAINFSIKTAGLTKLEIFNILGQKILTVINKPMEAGHHQIIFNAENLPAGIYFYQMTSGDFVSMKKFVLIK